MNWIMEKIKGLVISLIGVALVLGWWTIRGPSKDPNHTVVENQIPAVFWEGGSHTLDIEATTTGLGIMRVSMERPNPKEPEGIGLSQESWEKMQPGTKRWTIQFPADAPYGMIELGAENPNVGDKINWIVKLDNKIINQDEATLDKPLEPNTAMFLQIELEDFLSTGVSESEDVSENASE